MLSNAKDTLIEAASIAAQKVEDAKKANLNARTKNISLSDDQIEHISSAKVPIAAYDGNVSADDALIAREVQDTSDRQSWRTTRTTSTTGTISTTTRPRTSIIGSELYNLVPASVSKEEACFPMRLRLETGGLIPSSKS